ncbi:helix-turn-helix domain-containing protein [Paenibacillus luteus]|uniref:helix-turn-helix domain-containing protein n=1 Tax=Paenibacillus luteus TaxID=2545753 RepID=UPI0011436A95|nr:helix-turn-helix domain-containing protein [Paenibacillus luteus]
MENKAELFVKLHINAYRSGLMGAIYKEAGANAWLLLCALACFMNDERKCWPTQAQLAKELQSTEKSVQRWTSELLSFRWKGRPIVTAQKKRTTKNPEHFYNLYTIHPAACFSIFNDMRNGSGSSDSDEIDWEAIEAEAQKVMKANDAKIARFLSGVDKSEV